MSMKSLFPTLWGSNPGCKNPYCHLQYDLDRTVENPTDLLPLIPRTAAVRHASYSHDTPELDLSESADEVTIEVEIPGVELEDIELMLDGSSLVVRAEKQSHRAGEKDYRVVERSCGKFQRTVPLGFEPEDDAVRAKYRNGVLTVTVVKPVSARPA